VPLDFGKHCNREDIVMKNKDFDSYCGIFCEACDIQVAAKTGIKSKFATFWSEKNIELYQKSQGYTYDTKDQFKLKCSGCKSEEVFINCRICKIRECAISKGVEHCSNCKDYKCLLFINFEKGKAILPHLAQAETNLNTIQSVGMEAWKMDQTKKWACPNCQTSFSWYATSCKNCGANLKKLSYGSFNWIRSFLFNLGINSMTRKQKSLNRS